MIDPNKPIIDVRSTVIPPTDPEDPTKPVNGSTAAPAPAPKPAPAATPAPAADGGNPPASSTTVKTTTVTPISSTIPEEFKVSSYADLIPELEKRMAEYKPLTEEELKKLRRRQKAEGIISGISDAVQSIANLAYTSQYAPNMYNPKEGMSAKAKERFDKEKAQREADADKYLNYALTIGKLKDADKERGLQAWQTEQTLARQDRAHDEGRQDRADDVAFRNKDYDERVRQWQANFDRQGEWHEEEGKRWERQFNVSTSLEKQRIGLEAQRLAQQVKQGQMTFNLGSGNGNVTLSLDKLNAQTVSRIYHTLPADVRAKVQGDPIMGKDILGNTTVIGYKEPSTESMLIAIGANVEGSPATQNAIRQLAGLETGDKPKAY